MSSRCLVSIPALARVAALSLVAVIGACADGVEAPDARLSGSLASHDLKAYRLGVGDKVRLIVFGEPDMSGTHEINSQGRISLPLAGDVQAAGLDATSLRDTITRKYSEGYLKNPKLTIEVVGFRPVYVHGEVRSGGEFPYKTGLRFRDAIALAGGYTYRANQGFVFLSRVGASPEVRVPMASEMIVMPGDNIRVPERFF